MVWSPQSWTLVCYASAIDVQFFPLNNRSTVATIISRLIDFKVNLIAKRNQQSFAKYSRDIKRLFFHFELWILKKKKKNRGFRFAYKKTQKVVNTWIKKNTRKIGQGRK